jgi:hypothetical protein
MLCNNPTSALGGSRLAKNNCDLLACDSVGSDLGEAQQRCFLLVMAWLIYVIGFPHVSAVSWNSMACLTFLAVGWSKW